MILFIALPEPQDKSAGVTAFPLALLPRKCPRCGEHTIIGHGRRRRQCHDDDHDWIWVRRGLCRPCGVTFTILPSWSPPSGHYSYHCRQQAWQSRCGNAGSWEKATPHTKDPDRLPDPATLRRWSHRSLVSLFGRWRWFWSCALDSCFRAPTILAWDWPAAGRTLQWEVNSS